MTQIVIQVDVSALVDALNTYRWHRDLFTTLYHGCVNMGILNIEKFSGWEKMLWDVIRRMNRDELTILYRALNEQGG